MAGREAESPAQSRKAACTSPSVPIMSAPGTILDGKDALQVRKEFLSMKSLREYHIKTVKNRLSGNGIIHW
jgi:hypothetical protein